MFTETNRRELETKGYTVVNNVVSADECEKCIQEYRGWLSQFKGDCWPYSKQSLMQRYDVSHYDATWRIRIQSKTVFAALWKTEKLLSSFDAIAIGRPPEDGEETFAVPGQHWIHCDQNSERVGLHSYQGAVYLEEAEEDDWTFYVVKKSHLYMDEFYKVFPKAGLKSAINKYVYVREEDMEWFESKGCKTVRVPVPKGGIVLWDSRLLHANARPLQDRKNAGRWRYVVFVSMTPAIWATKKDLEIKQHAYRHLWMTSHWSSQGVVAIETKAPSSGITGDGNNSTKSLPQSALTKEAMQLSGVTPYDFNDGYPNGPDWKPVWIKLSDDTRRIRVKISVKFWAYAGIILFGGGLGYIVHKIRSTSGYIF